MLADDKGLAEKLAAAEKQLAADKEFYEEALEARTEQLEELEGVAEQKSSELAAAQA